MANIKSQIKRIRTNRARELKNMSVESAIKTYITKFNRAIETQDKEAAEKLLKQTVISIDKAVSDGIVHRNNAANKKSSMMKKYHLMVNAKPEETVAVAKKPAKKPAAKKVSAKTKPKVKTKKA